MKRAVLALLAAALAGGLALTGCSGGSDAVDQTAKSTFEYKTDTAPGQVMPKADRKPTNGFAARLLDGGTFRLASTRGKVVVLNFWASWCTPCQTETPQFDLLYRQIKKQPVAFVGIDTKDDKGSARSFVENNHISFPIVYDEQGETALRMGNLPATSLPFTVLLDRTGKVAAVYLIRMTAKDLRRGIDKLLAGR